MNPTNPKELVTELREQYALSESNITVKENGDIAFDLEGLQIMASQLCTELASDELSPRPFHDDQKYFYCDSTLKLKNGLTVKRTGVAMMGELLGDDVISSVHQALSISAGRAYRLSLRAISFDPIRAHKQKANGMALVAESEDERSGKLRKELHALATELGYIVGADRSAYIELLRVMYGGRASSTELRDDELMQLITFLRASLRARQRGQELKAA